MIQALLSLPDPYIEKRNRLSEQITNRNNEMHTLKQQAAASDTGTQSASYQHSKKNLHRKKDPQTHHHNKADRIV